MNEIPTVYRGSVKDVLGPLRLKNVPTPVIAFQYTDAYSIFDWGRMPDLLLNKGHALAVMAADFFERIGNPTTWKEFSKTPEAMALRKGVSQFAASGEVRGARSAPLASTFNDLGEKLQAEGMRNHYLGGLSDSQILGTVPGEALEPVRLSDWSKPLKSLAVQQVAVVKPTLFPMLGRSVMDYQSTRTAPSPRLIPIELVFRYGIPAGSSLLERVQKDPAYFGNVMAPKTVTHAQIQPGARFEFPLLELFTKLEASDRPLSPTEAIAISGIASHQLEEVLLRSLWLAGFLKHHASKVGLELADGKFEWAIDSLGNCMLVDAIGPDELRFLRNGVQLSKEVLRTHYRHTSWYDSLQQAKRLAQSQGAADWKRLATEQPPALPPELALATSQLYQSLANALTGRNWFPEAWSLEKVSATLGAHS